jgi:predicted Zn-dependent peptidase
MQKNLIKKLKNGFVIGYIPHIGVKSVTLQLRGLAGSNYERKNEIGVSHLVEHMSLESPLKNKILSKGGKVVAVTSRDDVLFMVKVLKTDFRLAIDYLYEVFKFHDFSQDLLNIQKSISEEEVKRFINVPEKLIGRISYRLLFPKQRMSEFNIGSVKSIQKASLASVKDFKERVYLPSNFSLVVSGDLDSKNVINQCLEKFGLTKKGVREKGDRGIELLKAKGYKCQNLVNRFFVQTHVRIDFYGFSLSDSEKYTGIVLARILDNFLKSEVKIKKGYAYNIGCESFSSYNYGVFSFYLACDKKNISEVLRIVFGMGGSLSKIATKESILTAKNQIISDMEFSYEKTSFRAEYYSGLMLQGHYNQSFLNEMNKIKKVSYKELLSVFKTLNNQEPKITILSDSNLKSKVRKIYQEFGQ